MLLCTGLAKQARPGKPNSGEKVFIPEFPDSQLCPVGCLSAYVDATRSFRQKNNQLFLATVAPHGPVSSSSIARWLKSSIKDAGMDGHFTAHSTRSAATTAAALSGMSTQDIVNQANWSKDDTFCRFYYRPSQEEKIAKDFGRAVLGYKPA